MTIDENLDWLYRLRSEIYVYMPIAWIVPMNNAVDMAIKALEQEPCGDAISRQAVIKAIYDNTDRLNIAQAIRELPSVNSQEPNSDIRLNRVNNELNRDKNEQEPKTGHWSRKTKVDAYDIAGVKTWGIKCQCDRCDFTTIVVEDFGYYKYCPNCGCRMLSHRKVRIRNEYKSTDKSKHEIQ